MLEKNVKHGKRWGRNSHNLHTKNLLGKTLTYAVLSLLLLSTTMIIASPPQNSVMGQPTPTPAPTPAPAPSSPAATAQTPQVPQTGAPQLQAVPQLSPESAQTQRSVPQLLERSVANLPNIP
jgi:hypothetical protein